MNHLKNLTLISLILGFLLVSQPHSMAQESIGRMGAVIGKVWIIRGEKRLPAKKNQDVFAGDQIKTEAKAMAKILLKGEDNVTALSSSEITLEKHGFREGKLETVKQLVRGKLHFFTKPRSKGVNASLQTKNAVMGIRGTSGIVEFDGSNETSLVVLEGQVEMRSAAAGNTSVLVQSGFLSRIQRQANPTPPQRARQEDIQAVARTFQSFGVQMDNRDRSETLPAAAPGAPEPQGQDRGTGSPQETETEDDETDEESQEGSDRSEPPASRLKQMAGEEANLDNRPVNDLTGGTVSEDQLQEVLLESTENESAEESSLTESTTRLRPTETDNQGEGLTAPEDTTADVPPGATAPDLEDPVNEIQEKAEEQVNDSTESPANQRKIRIQLPQRKDR